MTIQIKTRGAIEAVVAAFGLPGSEFARYGELDDRDWTELVSGVKRERMEGLLVAAIEAGVVASDDSRIAEVRALGRARARVDLELERETLRTVGKLESEGVDCRVLKGPALAHLVYPNPMWRGFGDVDLLLQPESWYKAISILERSGARRVFPEIRPGFDVRFGKDATLLASSGWEIDLHHRLVLGPYGFWARSEDLFANRPAMVRLGNKDLPALEAEDAFVYACYTAALADDPPRLMALRDVAQIACANSLDVEQVVERACRWRALDVVTRALSLSENHLQVPLTETPIARRFRRVRSRASHRALMATYRGPGRGYTSQLAGVVALSGIREKLGYLTALARPQDDYLSARGFTPFGFIAHAGRRIRSRR